MEIGIDSFAGHPAKDGQNAASTPVKAMNELLERMQLAEEVGLDVFGIGQHFRKDFRDAAQTLILAAAAARTKRIRLTSAVTVLSE